MKITQENREVIALLVLCFMVPVVIAAHAIIDIAKGMPNPVADITEFIFAFVILAAETAVTIKMQKEDKDKESGSPEPTEHQ